MTNAILFFLSLSVYDSDETILRVVCTTSLINVFYECIQRRIMPGYYYDGAIILRTRGIKIGSISSSWVFQLI